MQFLTVTECFPLDKYLMCILHLVLTTIPQMLQGIITVLQMRKLKFKEANLFFHHITIMVMPEFEPSVSNATL